MPAPQNPYFIRGTVTSDGAAQSGATVTVRNDTKSEEDTCVTDAQGHYVFMLNWLATDYAKQAPFDSIKVTAIAITKTTIADLTNHPSGRELDITLYGGGYYYYKTLLAGGCTI